jgi:hypothetical protein
MRESWLRFRLITQITITDIQLSMPQELQQYQFIGHIQFGVSVVITCIHLFRHVGTGGTLLYTYNALWQR